MIVVSAGLGRAVENFRPARPGEPPVFAGRPAGPGGDRPGSNHTAFKYSAFYKGHSNFDVFDALMPCFRMRGKVLAKYISLR